MLPSYAQPQTNPFSINIGGTGGTTGSVGIGDRSSAGGLQVWWPTSRNSKIIISVLVALVLFQFLTLTLTLLQQQQLSDSRNTAKNQAFTTVRHDEIDNEASTSQRSSHHTKLANLANGKNHKSSANGRLAYVTLTTNDNYFQGIKVLSKSLKNVGSKAPLYCMVTPTVSQETKLKMKNEKICEPIVVQSIASPYSDTVQSRWADTFTKLRVFELVQFSTVIFLDADMIVLHNIDHLFDVLVSNRDESGQEVKTLAAAMDCCDHFNSGVMVLKPSSKTFAQMIKGMRSGELQSYDKADQGLLNSYYGKNFVRLDFRYNVDQMHVIHYPHAYDLNNDVSVLHYVHVKPWNDHQYDSMTPSSSTNKLFESEMNELKKLREIWLKIANQQ